MFSTRSFFRASQWQLLNNRRFHSAAFQFKSKSGKKDGGGVSEVGGSKKPSNGKTESVKPTEAPSSQAAGEGSTGSTNATGGPLSQLQKALSVIEGSLKERGHDKNSLPEVVVLPVRGRPLFPGLYKAINVHDRSIINTIKENLQKNNSYIGVFLTKDEDFEEKSVKSLSEIYNVGIFAQIYNVLVGPNDTMTLLLFPHGRVKIRELKVPRASVDLTSSAAATAEGADNSEQKVQTSDGSKRGDVLESPSTATIEMLHDEEFDSKLPSYRSRVKELLDTLNEIGRLNPLVRDQMPNFMNAVGTSNDLYQTPGKLADFAAAMSDGSPAELQDVLECLNIESRLDKSILLLKQELVNAELQSRVSKELERQINDRDREYFLRERLRNIQRELGIDSSPREKLLAKYRKRVEGFDMPVAAKKVFEEEMSKMIHLKPSAQEYSLTTNYLDWLTQLPWSKFSDEKFNIKGAKKDLDEDHYGMKDVKQRILEFIAVGKTRGSVQGKIICLVGPPGVGKTSIGRSIAKTLNRQFYRLSVGGLYDVAEIKGHRRTYVGSMPGKLVQALKKVQTSNPLILIDEIDKIGRGGYSGDPTAALLEVLDPEQNDGFLDHYLDIPVDLSKVLFVCTANSLDTIPAPLLDRMEVIQLSGYVAEEKNVIAERYLIPRARTDSGLADAPFSISKEAVDILVHQYCRESGVRNLKKFIEKVCRKAAFRYVQSDHQQITTVDRHNLSDYIGSPIFVKERMYDKNPVGVVTGLAYNDFGGSTLYIESAVDTTTSKDETGGRLFQTGNMGDVMKESSQIAYSHARSFMSRLFPNNEFFQSKSIHLHVPEGAVPKDGPSAGLAMCSSLVSLALGHPIELDVAMTGELSLTGRALRIGGVKEKLMAAKRSGVKHIVFPKDNQSDFEEFDESLKEGIHPHFVESFEDLFSVLFPSLTK